MNPESRPDPAFSQHRRVEWVLVAPLLFVAVLLLQFLSGAHSSDLGADPDEPAHYVTGLMLAEYLHNGIPQNPLHFAQDYYDHYPKVALGHYPPAFYCVESLWMLAFGHARFSVLLLQAALSTVFACLTYGLLRRKFTPLPAAAGALLCAALPIVQQNASLIMSDLLLGIGCLSAALALTAFLETGRARHALAFGLLASFAIMTKRSAIFLALLVPAALLLSGRLCLLKKPALWLAPLPVILICAPWLILTYKITEEGMTREPMLAYLITAASFFSATTLDSFGFALLIPALIAVAALAAGAIRNRSGIDPLWAVTIALPPSLITLFLFVPGGLDARYLIPAVPSVIALSLKGLVMTRDWLTSSFASPPRTTTIALCTAIALAFVFEIFRIPRKHLSGFSDAARFIIENRTNPNAQVLVSSGPSGEGALIAEIAMREPRPQLTVHRASKVLSSSDWLGRGYELKFKSGEELLTFLTNSEIEYIVVDQSVSGPFRVAHHDLVASTLEDATESYSLAHTGTAERRSRTTRLSRPIHVYQDRPETRSSTRKP